MNKIVIHIIGSVSSGKTSFINTLSNSHHNYINHNLEICGNHKIINHSFNLDNINIDIYEIFNSFNNNPYINMPQNSIPKADKIILLYDTNNYDSYLQCLDFYNEFVKYTSSDYIYKNIIICNNKSDKKSILKYSDLLHFNCTVFSTNHNDKDSILNCIKYLVIENIFI